ncbi:MAG: hypothetical protein H7841_02140 [Magnetospirillum sp. WYHS-4]
MAFPSRGEATRAAAMAVAVWRGGGTFAFIHADGRIDDLDWPPEGREPWAYFVLLAESRGRLCELKELRRRHPEAWPAVAAAFGLPPGGPDETMRAAAVAALNAPKVWTLVQGVAGALLARSPLPFAEVAAAGERVVLSPFIPSPEPEAPP